MDHTQQARTDVASAAADAIKAIAVAKEAANRDILIAKNEAQKVVLSTADQTAKVLTVGGANDHDFMLTFASEIRTKVDGLIDSVKKLDDGMARRIDSCEKDKLNITDSYPYLYKKIVDTVISDHEKRINKCETNDTRFIAYGLAALFVMSILEFFVSNFIK